MKKILFMFLTIAIIIMPLTISASAAFTDVSDDHPYKEAIEFCKEKGFVIGENPTTFNPDFKLQRAHFAIIWCRTLNIKDDNHNFNDITSLRQYFDGPAIILNGLGLFKGTSDSIFAPENYITREQLAVITMRTYNLGVANPEAYQRYDDHEQISDWAHNGVSSCINADVFRGLYNGDDFKPHEPVTRAEICKLIYNISRPAYHITIGTLDGGTITASPAHPHAGDLVTLTITPDEGKQIKAGTLKYDDVDIVGTTFTMPARNITITAEFEEKPVILTSIEVTNPPDNTIYNVGQQLDLDGLIISAVYSDNTKSPVTGYTTVPAGGSTLNLEGTVTVNVYYQEKTVSFTVEVSDTDNQAYLK